MLPLTNMESAQVVLVATMPTVPLLWMLMLVVVSMLLTAPATIAVITALKVQNPAWVVGPKSAPPPPSELPPQAVRVTTSDKAIESFLINWTIYCFAENILP